jgi:hypothetical protein
MYPEQQLEELAERERALRWRIGQRRERIAAAAGVVFRRLAWVDHALVFWRARYSFGGLVSPVIGGTARALLGKFVPRLARIARWGALLAGTLRLFLSRTPPPRTGVQPRPGAVR